MMMRSWTGCLLRHTTTEFGLNWPVILFVDNIIHWITMNQQILLKSRKKEEITTTEIIKIKSKRFEMEKKCGTRNGPSSHVNHNLRCVSIAHRTSCWETEKNVIQLEFDEIKRFIDINWIDRRVIELNIGEHWITNRKVWWIRFLCLSLS